MTILLAHAAPGFQAAGLSPGLVLYLTAAGVALVTLALRARVGAPVAVVETTDRWPGEELPSALRTVLGGLGVVGLAATLWCAWFGSAQIGVNPVTATVFSVFWLGGQLVSVLLGDLWRLVDPFDHLAGWFGRGRAARHAGPDLWWLPALLLASFGWTWLAWPDGLLPRSVAKWLLAYTVVMVVGGVVAGRGWVRRHEAFGVAFGLVASASPIDWSGPRPRLRNPIRSLADRVLDRREGAVLAVLLGIALFDAVSFTQWWADVLGVRSVNGYTAYNTLGLVWLIASAGIAWMIAARVAGYVAGDAVGWGPRLAAPLAALAAGFALAHEIGTLVYDTRRLPLLLTDPLARGWDVLGTADWVALPTPPGLASWLSLIFLEGGCFLLLPALHRKALARFGLAPGVRAGWAFAGFVLVASIVGLKLLVGL